MRNSCEAFMFEILGWDMAQHSYGIFRELRLVLYIYVPSLIFHWQRLVVLGAVCSGHCGGLLVYFIGIATEAEMGSFHDFSC